MRRRRRTHTRRRRRQNRRRRRHCTCSSGVAVAAGSPAGAAGIGAASAAFGISDTPVAATAANPSANFRTLRRSTVSIPALLALAIPPDTPCTTRAHLAAVEGSTSHDSRLITLVPPRTARKGKEPTTGIRIAAMDAALICVSSAGPTPRPTYRRGLRCVSRKGAGQSRTFLLSAPL